MYFVGFIVRQEAVHGFPMSFKIIDTYGDEKHVQSGPWRISRVENLAVYLLFECGVWG